VRGVLHRRFRTYARSAIISFTLDQGKWIGYSGPNGDVETAQYPLDTYRTRYPSFFHGCHSPGLRQLLPHPELARPGHPIRFTRNPALGHSNRRIFLFGILFAAMETRPGALSFN